MDVSVLLFRRSGEPDLPRVRERNVHGPAQVPSVEGAELQCPGTAELLGGFGADDVDRTADGVTAEQRPLGSAQDLHAIDVEHIETPADRARHVDAIDVSSDAGFGGQ